MAILSSSRNKIIVLFLISVLVFVGWQYFLETAYTKTLVVTTNSCLSIFTNDTHIELEKKSPQSTLYEFRVYTTLDGRKGNYPQDTGGILQPFIIILSWQIFLFLAINKLNAFRSLIANIGIFSIIQILFMVMLTNYYSSTIQQYLFTMMLDSFYIIALILIIKDNIFYGVFKQKGNKEIDK